MGPIGVINEQGDLGLNFTPLNEQDEKTVRESDKDKDSNNDKNNNK